MAPSSRTHQVLPELAPETVEVLQAATRVLAGVALRSVDVLDGAVTLPQFRMLAVLAGLGRARRGPGAGGGGGGGIAVPPVPRRPGPRGSGTRGQGAGPPRRGDAGTY